MMKKRLNKRIEKSKGPPTVLVCSQEYSISLIINSSEEFNFLLEQKLAFKDFHA
jgi:hypothetical protein